MNEKYVVYMVKSVAGAPDFFDKMMSFDEEKHAKDWVDNYLLNSRYKRVFSVWKEVDGIVVEKDGKPVPTE